MSEPIEDKTEENETDVDEAEKTRQSIRERQDTEKMAAFKADLSSKVQDRLNKRYASWKLAVRNARKVLAENLSDEELDQLCVDIKTKEGHVLDEFNDFRRNATATKEMVRKVDACSAVTRDLVRIIDDRISGVEEYERDNEVYKLSALKGNSYANSVFSAITERSDVPEKMAEAAVDLAEKQIEYEHLLQDQKQRSKIRELEIRQRVELEGQHEQLKALEARKSLTKAQARVNIYSKMMQEPTFEAKLEAIPQVPSYVEDSPPSNGTTSLDAQALVQTLTHSINLNRLPVPEPSVFTGDPLNYVEWKSSFTTLIDQRAIPADEKIFYLKKYTGGPARQAIQGYFFVNNSKVYENALTVLDERYGHPFVVQRAFRDKLEKWPKISAKDSFGLRDFSDFLRACRDAMSNVPSLEILNDCVENQKLMAKLPEWALHQWNRKVTDQIEVKGVYPSLSDFTNFVVKEAKIACNPVSSPYALTNERSKPLNETKPKSNVKSFATETKKEESNDSAKQNMKCDYCNKSDHFIFKCEKFLNLSLERKRIHIKENNLCYGCLRKGHVNKECKRKHTCAVCKKRHPTCLHEDRPVPTAAQSVDQNYQNVPHINNNSITTPGSTFSTSMIVPVWISSPENPAREILTYAMLDTQSDTTFVLSDTAKALNLTCQRVKLSLSTMTSKNTHIESSKVSYLKVREFDSAEHVIINQAYTREFIPVDRSHIPHSESIKAWPHLSSLSDKIKPLQSCEVGLLIGYNCPKALAPINVITGGDSEPYAVQTVLGWSVIGYGTNDAAGNPTGCCHRTMAQVKEIPACSPRDLINVLEKDFANDGTIEKKVSQNDLQFLNIMQNNILECDNKHLQMPLPFKERPVLPNNRSLALIRFNHLKRKLNDQKYNDHYTEYMAGLIERGEAERASDKGEEGNIWYIPHHGVYHPQKKDKIRVVFDCSARYRNTSLNDHLLTGPDLTNNLVGVLCRFREKPIAIMCDIEGMFHQFAVCKEDRDFLRFLWWEDGDPKKPLIDYRMTVHLFGAASSPGCANYGLKFLAKSHEDKYPKAAEMIKTNFYVDDGLTSLETVEEAVQMIEDARKICKDGGLKLHKFVSNSKAVMVSIPASERAAEVKDLDFQREKLPSERALGVKWYLESDSFGFEVNVKDQKATRRSMLSTVASVFDPLGFLAPFTLIGKRLLQEICKENIGWDESVSRDIQFRWEKWISELEKLKEINIARPIRPADFGKPLLIELHHFSDASSYGYGQCSYVRFIFESRVFCAFLLGKARVAPLKLVSIPRLELTAAVLSAKMSKFLREELAFHIDAEYFWTDSRVVLGYINNEANGFTCS